MKLSIPKELKREICNIDIYISGKHREIYVFLVKTVSVVSYLLAIII